MTKGYRVLSLETAKSKPSKATVAGFDIDTDALKAKEAELAQVTDDEIMERLRTRFTILV